MARSALARATGGMTGKQRREPRIDNRSRQRRRSNSPGYGLAEDHQPQTRLDIEQAAAIVYYRQQTEVPVVPTLICDDARQFKFVTENLSLCWIHQGRHYARLTPVVPSHAEQLSAFQERFWDYYAALQR